MKKIFFPLLSLLLTTACTKTRFEGTNAEQQVSDSTNYGTCVDEFGMSTFAVRTQNGDTLSLMRSSNAGVEAEIFGDLRPGDEFAFTTTDSMQSLVRAINLTQVKSFTQDYALANGRLVLNVAQQLDTVAIQWLDTDSLIAQGRRRYEFFASKHSK